MKKANISSQKNKMEKGDVDGKQAEEALRQSQERYRTLVEATFEGIVITENGIIIEANPQFAQMYGYPLEEVYGMQLSAFVVTGEKTRVVQVLSSGREKVGEYRARRKDGSEFLTEAHGRVFEMGQRLVRITSIRDITERKQMELDLDKYQAHLEELVQQRTEQLQASEERYRSLFENQHTAMLLIDPKNGAIVDVNPAAVSFYGYPRHDFLKMNISEINTLPPSQVNEDMERARTEQRLYFDFKHRLANNTIVDVEVYSGPIVMGDKQLLYSVIHDNTERIQAEEALRISEEKYRSLFEDAIEGIVQSTPQGKYLTVNNAYARIFGYASAEEMILSVTDVASQIYANPEDRARLIKLLETSDRVEAFEAQGFRKNGQKIWCSFNVNAVRGAYGEILRLDSRLMDITERKQAEDSLRANEERLELATRAGNIGIWDWDVIKNELSWDDSMYTLYGIRKEDWGGAYEAWAGTLYPEDREYTEEEIQAALSGEREYAPEFRIVRPDGSVRVIKAASHTFRDANGQALRMIGTNIDITERKQVEDLLRANEQRLMLATRAGSIGIWDWDIIKDELIWDDSMFALYGIHREDFDGPFNAWINTLHPDDLDSVKEAIQAAVRGEREFASEFRIVRPNGSIRIIKASSLTFRDQNNRAVRMIGTNIDITERKRVEEELFNSQQMLQMVLDTIPQRVFWKDSHFIYLGCNKAFASDAGFASSAEIVGMDDFSLPWQINAPSYRADDLQVMSTGVPKLNFEELQGRPDGSQYWVKTNKTSLYDRNGQVIGILGTYEDINSRKQAEQQLQITNEKLVAMVSILEMHNQEARLLREMDDLLQVCNFPEEAYAVIQQYAPRLFPSTSGALYHFNISRRAVEAAAIWGENLQSEPIFSPDDCWTLRRGQLHQWSSLTAGLRCRHIPPTFSGDYLDVPMLAAGELMGLLHLENTDNSWRDKAVEDLARSIAEHLALSLSNIKLREKLHAQSIRDPLTGLFNRRYMEESLERELHRAARAQTPVGIIMLDIDHFKEFNDTYGHEAGDVVLHELGILLQSQIRGEDIACRFGGEEFILILPEASLEISTQRAEKIRQATKALAVEYLHKSLGMISVSMGVAVFPTHSTSAEGLLRNADKALYQAKHNGRDRVEVTE